MIWAPASVLPLNHWCVLEKHPNLSKLSSLSNFANLSEGKLSFLYIVVLIIQIGIWRWLIEPEK